MGTDKRIIITGINGFMGRHIASILCKTSIVHGLDTDAVCYVQRIDRYSQMNLPHEDFQSLMDSFAPDYCIHCAGSASVPLSVAHPSIDFDAGPVATFHVLEAIRKSGIKCCTIFPSSAAVYGNAAELPIREGSVLQPISPYGYHKILSERILQEFHHLYKLPYLILRMFSAYGNGLRKQLLWDTCQRLVKKDSVFWGTGDETRDFIHVSDVARLIAHLIERNMFNKILNVGSGEQVPTKRIIQLIAECLKYPIGDIQFKGETRKGDPLNWEADISQIRSLGFKNAVPLDDGVREYVEWFKNSSLK